MSSVIFPSEMYSGQNKKGRSGSQVKKVERIFTGFIILLLCIIILEILFHFLIAPSLQIDKIVISAEASFAYSDDYLLGQAGISKTDTFFNINTSVVEDRLSLIPAVKSVTVKKVFPSALNININGRTPIGLSLVSTDNGVVPAVIDSEGIVFMVGHNLAAMDLPVVSGIDFPEIRGGMRLPKELCSFLEGMDVIKKSSPSLYRLISEIKFVRKGSVDYEVLIYPSNYKTRIRIGPRIDEEMLKYMIMILEVIAGQPGMESLEELDFRTGDVIYRIQGE